MISRDPKNILKCAAIILTAVLICAASYFRFADHYELNSLDLRFILRYPKIPTVDNIALIEIGEDSIDKLGRFPFDRSYHAVLVKALSESGARMILFDLLFSEESEYDNELEYAMNQAGSVYLPYAFELNKEKTGRSRSAQGYTAKCAPRLEKEARGTGHINIVPDMDGKYRRIPLFIDYEGRPYPYISFVMGCDYLGIDSGKPALALDERGEMIVNYSGKWADVYKHYSYADVLQSYFAKISGGTGKIDMADFKDKICIVGLTAAGTADVHPNPFETIYPGMGIHGEVINSMITGNFISRASRKANLAILIFLSLVISILTLKTKPIRGLFFLFLEIFVFVFTAVLLFNFFGLWIDMIYPVLVIALLYLWLTLYKYIGEWKARLVFESELGIARKIQESFLPKKTPEVENADIACAMFTARQVGGDLYDFVELGDGKIGVMIGDVSGKGVPASLFMAMAVGAFRSFARLYREPKDVLSNLNTKLTEESSSGLFVTMFYAIIDFKKRNIIFSNGGHLPVMHVDRAGELKLLDVCEGMPLGLMEGNYCEGKSFINDKDILVFYTDGITEAMDEKHDLYEAERLMAVVRSNKDSSASDILKAIEKDVRKFEPKTKQHDDMTIIIVKV